MPRWLTKGLRAQLKAQALPYKLVDGPTPLESRPETRPHIELLSDSRTGDGFGPAVGLGTEAERNLMLITIGMEALIFGRAPKPAGVVDHDDQCRSIAKQLIVAITHVIADLYGILRWRLQPGRFLSREELEERRLTGWPGRVYRLGFSWDEAIRDTDYKGEGASTVDAADITYETETETEGAGGHELPGAHTEVL
jgi:hypothetical protein